MESSLYKGEELRRDVAARMALLKGQDAGNVNMSRVNENVAIKNSGNASQEDVSITKVAPTSFGEFSIMNPSSEPVGNNEENTWSFNHVGLKSNSTKLSSFGAKNPKTCESIWSSGGKSFVVNDCPPTMNYEAKGFQVGKELSYQPRVLNASSNGGGTHGEESFKDGWYKHSNEGASFANKNTLSDRQKTKDVRDTGAMKMSDISTPNLFAASGLMQNRPWVLLGDFNVALNLEDHSSGGYEPNAAMHDFKECVQAMEVSDFNDDFLGSFGIFHPYRILDHSPCVLRIPTGFAMYRVVKRLKVLKSPFHKLLHDHGNLHEWVNKIRLKLDEAQKAIDRYPLSSTLREEHAHYLLAFKEAQLDEERFLKPKAKVEWLKSGNSSTAYFHRIVKSKCARNMIEMFLGTEGISNPLDDHDLFIRVLDTDRADYMVCKVTDDEVKCAIFSMGDDRASGPDGFTVAFFKKAWDVVGGDITCAIWDFFFSNVRIDNRVKEGLGDIVSINHSAFVPGHMIFDNILLTQ
uniref:RNA-directed DNA polymerase, eukaryota, reverse transcriptase zinc-binding domain protein n=1 Tax=Tanacetum cinerariifolium TaxID=118510 RepID=A0A6L2NER2_TANCI|nr:hypothetical protein [Tanacetum cinerariifolium]